MEELVILVDEEDTEIGISEKIEAHKNPKLHRAFSIFIFDSKGKMLIHQRAHGKYHCPDLWTNACCSHPKPNESTDDAAHRRLVEEMGFDTKLDELFHFIYKAPFDNGLTEWELDHVFLGTFEGEIVPNPEEVGDFKYIDLDELEEDIKNNPDNYTPWFKIAVVKVLDEVRKCPAK